MSKCIMRYLLGTLLLTAVATFVNAQSVGINTATPHPSAILEVHSNAKGLLVPRLTTLQRNAIVSPASGLLVFDTDWKQFIFFADTGWAKIPAGNPSWTVSGNDQYAALGGYVGIGTPSPNGLLHVNQGLLLVTGNENSGDSLTTAGSGTRMFFYPRKAAFRAGHALDSDWDEDKLGYYSVALGNNPYAAGIGSLALGTGARTETSAANALAIGHDAVVMGQDAVSLGNGSVALGNNSFAMGNHVTTIGNNAMALGNNTIAQSFREMAMGNFPEYYIPISTANWVWEDRLLVIGNGTGEGSRSNALTLLKNGNLGIGSSNPTQRLEVAGAIKANQIKLTNGAVNGYVLKTDSLGNTSWANPNTLGIVENDPKVGLLNNHYIPKWNGSSLANGLLYDNGTNVGIGTTAPTAKLEVSGTVKATQLQMTNGAVSGYVLQGDAAGNATWVNSTALPNGNWTTAGSNQFSAVIGNVGIGTNSPSAKLDVAGTAKVTNFQMPTGATTGYVMRSDAVGNASWVNTNTLTVNETDPQVASTTGGRVPKWSGTSLVDGIMQDDGLGIGINTAPTPATALTVNGKTSTSSLQITTGAASGYILRSNGTTGNAAWADPATIGFPETDPQVAAATANTVPRWNGTALVDGQLVDNGTNIGIGTATPGSKLDVVGTIRTTALQLTTGATNGYLLQGNAAGVATWVNPASLAITETDPKVGTLTNNLIPRWNGTSLTNTQVFDNGTATGIATTAPLSVLDVNGAMGLKVRGALTSSSTNPDNTAGIWIYTTNSGPITLPAANTCANRMYVITNRAITPILINPATSYIGLNGILATNIAASSAIWIVSDGSVWQQIK